MSHWTKSAKKPGFFFPLLLCAFLTSNAQTFWESLNVPGRVSVWQLVRCGDTYILKAETGLYRSVDPGQAWAYCAATAPTDGRLAAIGDTLLYHANPGYGLFASTDKGISWQIISPSVPAAAAGLAADDSYIFYATANGIYRYPKEGGMPTIVLHFPLYQQFASLKISGNTLWASSNATLFKSLDSGNHWTEIIDIPDFRCFHPHGNTVLAGTKNSLLRSDDGGESWLWLDEIPAGIQQLDWQDGHWLALTAETPVLWSADDGAHWWPPSSGPFPNYGATSVVKNGPVWLVASHLGGVFRSPNYGEFWVASTTGLQSTPAYPAEWLDRAGDFLLFNIGFTHLSVDGGGTWFMPLPSSAYDPFSRVVRHQNNYFAASLFGHIYQQEMGNPFGWVQRSSGYLYNSTFGYGLDTRIHDLGNRMAVTGKYTEPNVVFQSTNGGQSWPAVGTLPAGTFSVEAFENQLYSLTSDGDCLASANVGASWSAAGEGLPKGWGDFARLALRSEALFFLDETRIFARKQTGQPFFEVFLPTEATGRIWDADAENGRLVVVADAGVFCTSDWGATWTILTENLAEQEFSDANIRLHQGNAFLLLPCGSKALWKCALPTSGTIENLNPISISISPNPLPNGVSLTVQTRGVFGENDRNIMIQIVDSQGKTVLSENKAQMPPTSEITLEDIALRPGLYFVQVYSGKKVAQCAVIKI